jgi:hypothetical protein
MACCLSNLYNLCQVDTCGQILIPASQIPAATGDYYLVFAFLETNYELKYTRLQSTDNLFFDLKGLNEYYEYKGQIIGPDGDAVILTINSVQYNGIQFETKKTYQL